MLARDERAHLRRRVHPVADRDLRQSLLDRRDERIGRIAHGDDDRHRHATLAGGAVGGADRRIGRHRDVGVRQNDHVVLGAAERLHPLPVLRARLVDVPRDRRRADEAQRRHVGMLEQRVDRHLVAVHDVEDAVGDPRLLQQLGREERGRRILLGRLQHEGVAARDRRRPHPHRNHRREVERRDARDHAHRLADRVHVDPRRDLLRELAFEQGRDPAGELDHLEAAGHLAQGIGENLAVLGDEELGDRFLVLMHELTDPEQHVRAAGERDRPPRTERLLRSLHREVDLFSGREIDGAALPAGGRVEHGARATRAPGDGDAADPVLDWRDAAAVCGLRRALPAPLRAPSCPPPEDVTGGYRAKAQAVSPASRSGRRAQANVFVYQPCSGCKVTPAPDEWTNQPFPT